MSGKYLLDTNVVIALFADDPMVRAALAAADEVVVPSTAIGELYYGAWNSERRRENLARIDEFTADSVVLGCDAETARRYGEIKSRLRQKGRPIPENDIWIASVARQHDLTLVTRDAHFGEIEGLRLETW